MKPKREQKPQSDGVFDGVEAALRRAGQRARETAVRTGTPLVIYRNGRIEKRMVKRSRKPNSNEIEADMRQTSSGHLRCPICGSILHKG